MMTKMTESFAPAARQPGRKEKGQTGDRVAGNSFPFLGAVTVGANKATVMALLLNREDCG